MSDFWAKEMEARRSCRTKRAVAPDLAQRIRQAAADGVERRLMSERFGVSDSTVRKALRGEL